MNLFDLSGEVAVVVGGTGRLGGAIAEGLADAGATVAVVGRNVERGQARAAAIVGRGGRASFLSADASSRPSLKAAHEQIMRQCGPPTILVNAVGGYDPRTVVSPERPFERITTEDWQAAFDLNLVGGALLPCQEFGPAMCDRRKGSIINLASVGAHVPLSRGVAYSAAKAALWNLTMFLAREWAPFGVRVNSITPGFFPSEQNRWLLLNPDGTPTERARAIFRHTAMGRFGEPHELQGAAVFLASERASSFVTGTDLRVDGGFLSQTI